MQALDDAFLEAAMPEPVVLLGQRLEPYSVGHELLLRRHGSPFVGAQKDFQEVENHFWMGVFICAHHWQEACAELRDARLAERIAKWRKKVGKISKEALAAKMQEFQSYVVAGSACPNVKTVKRHTARHTLGGPWLAALIAALLGRLHFGSFEEVMDCPYGLAQWLYCVWWEREGALVIRMKEEDELALVRAEASKLGLQLMRWEDVEKGVEHGV